MANADISFGLDNGPDLYICNGSGGQKKLVKLNDAGDILLDGKRIGDIEVPILSQVASASSSLDYTSAHVTNAYETHILRGRGIVVASDGVDMHLLVSNDGGSTFEGDANEYLYASKQRHSGGSDQNLQSSGATQMVLNAVGLSNVAAEGFNFDLWISGAADSSLRTVIAGFIYYYDSNTRVASGSWIGGHTTAEVVDGLRIIPSAGNITKGRVTLSGLMHT